MTFVPHLLPVRRGLLATCVVRSRGADLRALLEEHYAESHVVDVLPEGVVPELARVQQTDGAEIGVFEDRLTGDAIVDLRARQPRQGRCRPGDPERQPASSASTRRWGSGSRECSSDVRHRGVGLRCERSPRRHPPVGTGPRDRALDAPAVGAAVWTTNRVLAAPVIVSKRHLDAAEPQAVVINAGVANAATGEGGIADAERTAAEAATALGLRSEQVVVLSTGVIGVPLPMDRVLAECATHPRPLDAGGGERAAAAILTTDRWPKQAVVRV